jgi:hypothetical protein
MIMSIHSTNQGCNRLCTYMTAPVCHLTLLRVLVKAIAEETGVCALEASPLLQIHSTTISAVRKLFICPKVKLYNYLRKQGAIWPFNIIKI